MTKNISLKQRYRKAFGFPTSEFVMETDFAKLETKVLAAYSETDLKIVMDFYTGEGKVETIANQATWEPRLTCGKCGFRAATTFMFFGHTDRAHKVITNRA